MMKTKYWLFMFLFVLFPFEIKALKYEDYNKNHDPHNKLVYNIDEVKIDGDYLWFNGWAYINEKINTFGGQNYKISIIAQKESDNEVLGEITEDNYSKGNMLYSSLCVRGAGNNCNEIYHGFYKYKKKSGVVERVSGKNGNYPIDKPLASCTSGENCINYNPGFNIKFNIDSWKTKLSTSDKVIFIIKIDYNNALIPIKLEGTGCRYDYSSASFDRGYVGCERSPNSSVSRVLAFHESVLNSSGSELKATISSDSESKFKKVGDKGRLLAEGTYTPWPRHYFEYQPKVSGLYDTPKNLFKISTSVHREVEDENLDIIYKTRWYGLKVKSNAESSETVKDPMDGMDKYYHWPDDTGDTKYAPATWGIVDGITKLTFTLGRKPPDDYCEDVNDDQNKCQDAIYEGNCYKQISKKYPVMSINGGSCKTGSDVGEITVYKVYKFNEKTKVYRGLALESSPGVFNVPDARKLFDSSLGKAWPGIKWNQKVEWNVTREIEWTPHTPHPSIEYYYHVKRFYESPVGSDNCVKEEGWVTKDYLLGKGDPGIDLIVKTRAPSDIETLANELAENKWYGTSSDDSYARSAKVNNQRIRLGFPNSIKYDASNYNRYKGDSGVIEVYGSSIKYLRTNKFFAEEKFRIKKACLSGTNVEYKDHCSSDEFDGENYYYFAFDVPVGSKLTFRWGIDYKSLIKKVYSTTDLDVEKIRVKCELRIDEGNLETKNYRVIDLSNPFPNVAPTLDSDPSKSRAVNWINFWESASGFNKGSNLNYLYDRIDSTSPKYSDDLYTVDLTPDSIDEIREYNKEQLESRPGKPESKTYINATLDEDGTSQFIIDFDHIIENNPFSTTTISYVGEKGNDSP